MKGTRIYAYLICLVVLCSGCLIKGKETTPLASTSSTSTLTPYKPEIKTFRKTSDEVCAKDGKPIIRLYSTTKCPHCLWIKDVYDLVVSEYANNGSIIAHHWDLDLQDDTLTKNAELSVPDEEMLVYQKYNSEGTVPTFVFGCKYVRTGNGFERKNDLKAEEAEFRGVIEDLIKKNMMG